MLILSAAALVANAWVFAAHVRTIISKRRNPFTQEVNADEAGAGLHGHVHDCAAGMKERAVVLTAHS